jgi:hypothetical protein
VTSFVIEQFHTPDTQRSARRVDSAHRRAVEQLAGRSVWCIAATPEETPAADALQHLLGPAFGAGEEDALRKGRQDGDTLIPDQVTAGDVVVLHDPIAAALAPAIRERGAHAIWRTAIGRWEGSASTAWRFLHRSSPALDAYVFAWRSGPTAPRAHAGIAAYIAASGVLSAKEVDANGPGSDYKDIGWATLLADVVREDGAERVGGIVHARPSVALR